MPRTARAVFRAKQVRALSLLQQGQSYDQIAADLGYTSRAAAWRLVQSALADEVAAASGEYLQLSLDRLDAILHANWFAATEGADIKPANIVLRVIEAEIRLRGLDKPRSSASRNAGRQWNIVMTADEKAQWEAAGSPEMWNPAG